MITAVWAAASFVVAYALRHKPSALAAVTLLLALSVPSVARGPLTGGGALHPAAIFALTSVATLLLVRTVAFLDSALMNWLSSILLVMLAGHATILTMFGTGSIGQLANGLLAPLALFFLVRQAILDEGEQAKVRLMRILVIAAVIQASLALAQVTAGRTILFEAYYDSFYWFNSEQFSRGMGTMDHPLDLAMLLILAIPALRAAKSTVAQIGIAFILFAGILATQSRLGVLLGLVGVAYLAISGERTGRRIAASVGIVVGVIALFSSSYGESFIDRATSAYGSNLRRSDAITYIFDNIFNTWLAGGGYGSSYNLHTSSVLGSSLENGFAMFAYDFGWIAAAALLAFLAYIALEQVTKKNLAGLLIAVFLVAEGAGYSSFMTQSAAGYLLFFTSAALLASPVRQEVVNVNRAVSFVA